MKGTFRFELPSRAPFIFIFPRKKNKSNRDKNNHLKSELLWDWNPHCKEEFIFIWVEFNNLKQSASWEATNDKWYGRGGRLLGMNKGDCTRTISCEDKDLFEAVFLDLAGVSSFRNAPSANSYWRHDRMGFGGAQSCFFTGCLVSE
jgi:hypothetical protein